MSAEFFYLAQTKPRQERVAQEHLLAQGYQVQAPRIPRVRPRRVRSNTPLDEPLFPGYIFFAPPDPKGSIASVRSTVGIRSVVRFSGRPALISCRTLGEVISWVEDQLASGAEDLLARQGLVPGVRVRVREGPFCDLTGLISGVSEARILVLMELLGREQQIGFSPWELTLET